MSIDASTNPRLANRPGRTDYATAARGYDDDFRDTLIAAITTTIAEASICTDANVMALRIGEQTDALVICLISTMAMSPR